MKKFCMTAILVITTCTFAYSENIKQEAMDSLATAKSFVEGDNYAKAVEEINYALSKINELTAQLLLDYIPDAPENFTLVNKQSQGSGVNTSFAGNAGANANYSHSSGAEIKLNISIGGMTGKMGSLAALSSIFAGMNQNAGGEQSKQLRVKGYTGTQMHNPSQKKATLSFQVGQKTSVTLEGSNLDSPDIVLEVAKKIDFPGLEKNF